MERLRGRRLKDGARSSAELRPSRALLGFAVLLVLLVTAVAGLIVLDSRAKRLAEAERDVFGLSRILAEQTERTLQSVDFLLLALAEQLRAPAALGDRPAVHRLLRLRMANAPQLHKIGVFDADGVLRHDSRFESVPPIIVADRPYFVALRDPTTREPVISELLVARTDGQPVINLARRLPGPQGGFSGALVAALDPRYFQRLYDEIDPGKMRLITLVRDDGSRLVRHPYDPAVLATRISSNSPVMQRLETAPSGSFRGESSRSREKRIVAYQRLSNFPVQVIVAMPEEAVLAPWRKEAAQVLGGAAAIAAVLCTLVGLLARHLARGERLAEALSNSEARFRDFAEATSDWFWEQDETLAFTYVSDEIVHVTGRHAAEYIGKRRGDLLSVIRDGDWAAHLADVAGRRPFRDVRYAMLRSQGDLRHVSISGKPTFAEDGTFLGYRGVGRDVTQEILAAEQLRHAKAEAEAASAAKGEFLAVISHELRTPLNAIIGFSDLMAKEILGSIGTPKYREYAVDIFNAGQHLLALISNILDMSKIEARKMELHEAVFDVGAAIEASLRLVQQRAAEKGIALVNWVSPDLPRLRGDETRLRQILLNLLSNALKFTPPEGEVVLRSSVGAAGLELVVEDRGIGMSEAEVAIALQPFRQVESALSRTQEGTGLGLPLAKALVELHGGTFVIESAPAEGTTVRIRFPADRLVTDGPSAQAAL
jgi:PAS domain S-box-containing protein